ncbi:MAG: LiaI-LiaF-like domain-containing protein, partial [Candidatus Limnocylindrales bacterium]
GPAWHPVRRSDDGRGPSIVFGLILLAIGLWFFAEHTLGLDLPNLRWSQLWPLILIVVGVWVLFGARRRAR